MKNDLKLLLILSGLPDDIRICEALRNMECEISLIFTNYYQIYRTINEFWKTGQYPLEYLDKIDLQPESEKIEAPVVTEIQQNEEDEELFSRSGTYSYNEPEWYIGFADDFLKSIKGLDKKLQGRILEALKEISTNPVTPNGDTIKPLSNELKGIWRYRVGDYRVLYKIHQKPNMLVVLKFAHRSEVYE